MKIGNKKKNIVNKKLTPSKGKIAIKKNSSPIKEGANPQEKKKVAPVVKVVFPKERNLQSYLYKIIKKIQPEIGSNKEAMETMNSIILSFYDEIAGEAAKVSRKNGSHTLKATDVQTAAKLVLP